MIRKLIFLFVLISVLFTGCVFEDLIPTSLALQISKQNVKVGEEIEIEGYIYKAFMNNETHFIVHFEGCPEEYTVVEGKIYERWSNENYLCLFPVQTKGTEGSVRLKFAFDKPGDFTLKVNGCSINNEEIDCMWNEDSFVYKFTVTE